MADNLPWVQYRACWRKASPAMRIVILAACADTFYVLIDGLHFEPRCVDGFSKRRAMLALRQPAMALRNALSECGDSSPLLLAATRRGESSTADKSAVAKAGASAGTGCSA